MLINSLQTFPNRLACCAQAKIGSALGSDQESACSASCSVFGLLYCSIDKRPTILKSGLVPVTLLLRHNVVGSGDRPFGPGSCPSSVFQNHSVDAAEFLCKGINLRYCSAHMMGWWCDIQANSREVGFICRVHGIMDK